MIELAKDVGLDPRKLTNHVAVFGMSGSGKTGCVFNIVEGLIKSNVPCVLVDIKGDLINILNQSGDLRDKMDVTVLTPGGTHGDPVDMFASINDGRPDAVSALLDLLGLPSDPIKSTHHSFLTEALKYVYKPVNMEDLIEECLNPSFDKLGVLPLRSAISPQARKDIANKLNNLVSSETFSLWCQGVPVGFNGLLNFGSKVPVIIYSVAHLYNDEDKMFALSHLMSEFTKWTLSLSGTSSHRAALVIDECQGLLPPHPKNPSTKSNLMKLFKMARAFGVGMIIATQNTKEVDYKALANCGTWILGKLQTKLDRERAIENMSSSLTKKQLHESLTKLRSREFILSSDTGLRQFYSKDTETILSGPVDVATISAMKEEQVFSSLYEPEVPVKEPSSILKWALSLSNFL